MMGKKGIRGGSVVRCNSRYLAMLWKGFMNPAKSWDKQNKPKSDPYTIGSLEPNAQLLRLRDATKVGGWYCPS